MAGSDFRPGALLAGRFTLEDLLDENAGAGLWRATDRVLARDVAVHLLPSDDPRAEDLLLAARRSALVTDGHLLRVLDAAGVDSVVYVVHEWGSGVSLDRMLAEGPLSARRAAWLVREVAEAVSTAHLHDVAHGSLLPENVLVSETGAVKLIGFAVDAVLRSHAGSAGPHRVGDDTPLDPVTSDVLNLGALLYAALVGRWPGTTGSTVPTAPLEHGRPLRPRQVRAGVPRPLDAICERVLNGDAHPQRVPLSTAHEVYAALSDYIGDPGGASVPVHQHTGPIPGRAAVAPAAAAGAGAAAASDAAVGSGEEPTVRVAEDRAARPDRPEDPDTVEDGLPDTAVVETPFGDPTPRSAGDARPAGEAAGSALSGATAATVAEEVSRAGVARDADPEATQAGVPVFGDETASGWASPGAASPREESAPDAGAAGAAGANGATSPTGEAPRPPQARTPRTPPPRFSDPPERPLFAEGPRAAGARSVRPLPDDTGTNAAQRSTGAGNGPVPRHWGPDAGPPDASWGPDWFTEDDPRAVPGRRWLRLAVAVAVVLAVVVVAVVVLARGRDNGAAPAPSTPSATPSRTASAAARVPVVGIRDFDPEGDPPSENPDQAKLAVDGKPLTAWSTVTYRGNPKLGGLKSGVGLRLDLGRPRSVGSVRVSLLGTGTSLKLLAAPKASTAPTSTDGLATVAKADNAGQRVDLRLAKPVTTRWLVVWLTSLPSAPGGYQGRVAEISVRS